MSEIKTRIFEQNRPALEGLAYRMLGSLADAKDVVQDTYLKWMDIDLEEIQNARAWLIKVCSRLSLNMLQSARARRETYPGIWLPEPLIEEDEGPAARTELDETVSFALLLTLEKLTPAERAVYLLHDVFDYSFDEIAGVVGKASVNCRKIATRARKRIREDRPRFRTTPEEHKNFLFSFLKAARQGDLDQFKAVLADTVELHTDSGGKVTALTEVLRGSENVGRFFIGIWEKYDLKEKPRWFNGSPGALIFEDGNLTTAITLDIGSDGIQRIFAMRNPDKLGLIRAG